MRIFFLLLGCVASLSASEQLTAVPQKIAVPFAINVSCGRLSGNCVTYCSKTYVDTCNQNSIVCAENDPFLAVEYNRADVRHIRSQSSDSLDVAMLNNLVKLTHLPLGLFRDGHSWKKAEDILFCFKKMKIVLTTDFTGTSFNGMIEQFKKNPHYAIAGEVTQALLSVSSDEGKLKKELIKAEVLAEISGRIVHGPKGYFGDM